ncbi:MAG: DUF4760 domain-containing protein, partial [Pseudomonadota bacterium]
NSVGEESTADAPSFRDASIFILNQYEFIAAGIREGIIDEGLIKATMRSAVIDLCMTYQQEILAIRSNPEHRSAFANLAWLYKRFAKPHQRRLNLGPIYFGAA